MIFRYTLTNGFNLDTVNSVVDFYNSLPEGCKVIFYISDYGGEVQSLVLIKDIIENSGFDTELVGAYTMQSSAISLFIMCKNVEKRLTDFCTGIIHNISYLMESRDINKSNYLKDYVDYMNTYIYDIILNSKELEYYNKGEDVYLNCKKMNKLLTIINK